MKDIDFLPARYRERRAQRRARIYRLAMVGCVVAFVTAIAVAQQAVRHAVEQQLHSVDQHHPLALQMAARTSLLKKELAEAEAHAALYTYLRHPWPVTQLIAGVARAVPDSVTIAELRLETIALPAKETATGPATPVAAAATGEEKARRDLERLQANSQRTALGLRVTGASSDGPELHAFVQQLAPSPLFEKAKLESLETVATPQNTEARFELQLRVRTSYGQPNFSEQPFAVATRGGQP